MTTPETPRCRRPSAGTPSKPKSTDKAKPKKGLQDLGTALANQQNPTVQDKIRTWQTQGGGILTKEKTAAAAREGDNDKVEEGAASPKTPVKAGKTIARLDLATEKKDSANNNDGGKPNLSPKKPRRNALDEDVKNASAPPKRIVSDGHWRKNRSESKDETKPAVKPNAWVRPARRPSFTNSPNVNKTKPTPAKKTQDAIKVRIIAPKKPIKAKSSPSNSDSDTEEDQSDGANSVKSESAVIIPERLPSRSHRRHSTVQLDFADVKKTRVERFLDDLPVPQDFQVNTPKPAVNRNFEGNSYRHGKSTPNRLQRRRTSASNGDDSLRISSEAELELPKPTRQRRKRDIPKHDPVIAVEAEEESNEEVRNEAPVPPISGNRVEAWLTSTPDPFTETASERVRSSKSSSSKKVESDTLSESTTRNNRTHYTETELSSISASSAKKMTNKPYEDIKVEVVREKSRQSKDELSGRAKTALKDGIEDRTHTSSSPVLKRRGAKRSSHSPTKSRVMSMPLIERDLDEDKASSADSSIDPSALELPDIPEPPRFNSYHHHKRNFPSTGKRLSTIASVETFNSKLLAAPSTIISEQNDLNEEKISSRKEAHSAVNERVEEMSLVRSKSKGSKKKLASHADLMSVLSLPRGGSKSIVSARSIRTNRSRLANATIEDLLNELGSDEAKYTRELRTLVDGVIPVLLSCVLSKSDAVKAAGLFSKSASVSEQSITQPIVDMGVALERLKSLHKRIPNQDVNALLSWAQSAQRIYGDYIRAWRLGFQDVVVNLAPSDEPVKPETESKQNDDARWEDGMPQNAEGYVVNGDGERVDVAFLLKRPLVRLKYLAKTLKGINFIKPSDRAQNMADTFQELVAEARRRSNEERARLEDEAAASIDATRARDLRSLAPLQGVGIDKQRCVRARDYFDLHMLHSSGQELDCRVELLLRDEQSKADGYGDILVCEVDSAAKWLLVPPVLRNRVSARRGESLNEMIVMIRGLHSGGQEWHELLTLRTGDEQAILEWIEMLGQVPLPPKLNRSKSFVSRASRPASSYGSSLLSVETCSTVPIKSRTPSPHGVEIPIGEKALPTSKAWATETPKKTNGGYFETLSVTTPPSSETERSGICTESGPVSPQSPLTPSRYKDRDAGGRSSSTPVITQDKIRTPRSLNEAMMMAGEVSPAALRRTKAKRYSRQRPASTSQYLDQERIGTDSSKSSHFDKPKSPNEPSPRSSQQHRSSPRSSNILESPTSPPTQTTRGFSVWYPPSGAEEEDEEKSDSEDGCRIVPSSTSRLDGKRPKHEDRSPLSKTEPSTPALASSKPPPPPLHRRASSIPALDLSDVPKLRQSTQPSLPTRTTKDIEKSVSTTAGTQKNATLSAPPKLERIVPEKHSSARKDDKDADTPPPPPPHRVMSSKQAKSSQVPPITPSLPPSRIRRRSSSPLKHEYEPSTATESSTESEYESEESDSITSDSSDEESIEENIVPLPLPPLPSKIPGLPAKVSPPSSLYTLPNATLSPSQSASQSPYRTVPTGSGNAAKTIASIFAWSDQGSWESLHPDECSIVITPGLIQAFKLSSMHSKPLVSDGDEIVTETDEQPLVALELTPLVPLRRGTALDISVRSPPTANSLIRTSNNIMFRSRSAEECETLYRMINHSRINNPTYIALQNARGSHGETSWAATFDRRNAARSTAGSSSSWWQFGGSIGRSRSYRASSTRAPSIAAQTTSSVGTMASAFSALKRFSAGGRLFSLGRSTISSGDGTHSTRSFDSGGSGSGTNTPPEHPDSGARAPNAPPGITNTKIRLYERESQSKWRDLGSARLSIMLPDPVEPGDVMRKGHGSHGVRRPENEKRIVVQGKTNGETLLDVTLDESCFERVARTGIAVSVWEDVIGPTGQIGTVGTVGGVSGIRARVYMVQMKSERECAFSYSLLGKLRY